VLRRALAVAAAVAAVLVPTPAFAAPAQAPVTTYVGDSYYAWTQYQLSDGRTVSASLYASRQTPGDGWHASATIGINWSTWCADRCDAPTGSAYFDVPMAQTGFDRSLDLAALPERTVDLQGWRFDDGVSVPTHLPMTVSVTFTGVGTPDRSAGHAYDWCGIGVNRCQSIRVDESRDAAATVTLDGVSTTTDGSLDFGHGVEAAEPVTGDGGY
jgi:hypothetical protein